MPIELVLSDIQCKDSRIDSITYANDIQMYFFTSGGYYWWLKESEFPPPDNRAKRLPQPFVMGQAAVYVDSDSGCASAMTQGVKAREKEVWVEEYVGNEHKLMAFDTKRGVWRDQTIVYNEDHCISRARIDWASGKPLDAMFVRNYLQIYFVQNNAYAMVDCNYICNDPNNFGDDKPQYKTTDFHTVDPIYAMFVKRNKMLFMFHLKTYYELSIQPNSRDGRLQTIKGTEEKDIIRDFMKIPSAGQCLQPTQPPPPPKSEDQPSGGQEEGAQPPPASGSQKEDKPNDDSKGGGSLIVVIVVIVAVVAVIAIIAFFVMRPKSGSDDKEKAEKQKPSAVGPKPQAVKAGFPSKAGVPAVSANKPKSSVAQSSTITNKSNTGVVGIASKSNTSKSSTKK